MKARGTKQRFDSIDMSSRCDHRMLWLRLVFQMLWMRLTRIRGRRFGGAIFEEFPSHCDKCSDSEKSGLEQGESSEDESSPKRQYPVESERPFVGLDRLGMLINGVEKGTRRNRDYRDLAPASGAAMK